MRLQDDFFNPVHPSLKICGVTTAEDSAELVEAGVPALGVNFWPKSKRYCPPEIATGFLPELGEKIFRVGVFVNNAREVAPQLLQDHLLDAVQLHGDEPDSDIEHFLSSGVPVVRALSLGTTAENQSAISRYQSLQEKFDAPLALLLDAHAPGAYGGTGRTIDWKAAAEFIQQAHPLPVLLAGGLTPDNASEALSVTRPAGLDIASGAESAPGVKDLGKVSALQQAVLSPSSATS